MTALSTLTTLRLGGAAGRLIEARSEPALVDAVRAADVACEPVLLLGGGSNVVIADEGWPGTVIRIATTGIERSPDGATLTVQAGEPWDPFVAACVEEGLAGVECLSGIPGSVGATPIQNVGAYGQEVADTIVSVRALERGSGEVVVLDRSACAFTYRSSVFKREPGRRLVLAVTFALEPGGRSGPIRYAELARTLGVSVGASAPLAAVREAVLSLRRAKGMVVAEDDPDSVSAGSFFTNPILSAEDFFALEARVAERLGAGARLPRFPEPDGRIKTSAAWLVERAGFARGHGMPGPAAVSTKHSLALTNRGGATTAQLVGLAREIADAVEREFAVALVPEPVFVGLDWGAD
jgi:UDP-N-acetylmuramate dehydrogenase